MPLSAFHGNENISSICASCGIPNFYTSLFETTLSDIPQTSVATQHSYSILNEASCLGTENDYPKSASRHLTLPSDLTIFIITTVHW